jgi:hypothetical protein
MIRPSYLLNAFRYLPAALRVGCCALSLLIGCRSKVPIYVWQPAQFTCPVGSRLAIGPVSGNSEVAWQIEHALMMQRPASRGDLQLITAKQLAEVAPVRLASVGSLTNDAAALEAARRAEADFLLQGEVLSARLVAGEAVQKADYQVAASGGSEQMLTSWRLVDVRTSKTVATQAVTMSTERAELEYPDLLSTPSPRTRLVTASAREAWRGLAPSVEKDEVQLMVPWFQVGAIPTRAGIVDAHQGRWDLAEQRWKLAVRRNPLNIAARHNLAIAQVAREDFSSARERLAEVRWPLSTRLPPESRFWIDQRQRRYQAAHGLGEPAEGWLLPSATAEPGQAPPASAISIQELPWWTAIPLTKPPGWSWQAWLHQPWTL